MVPMLASLRSGLGFRFWKNWVPSTYGLKQAAAQQIFLGDRWCLPGNERVGITVPFFMKRPVQSLASACCHSAPHPNAQDSASATALVSPLESAVPGSLGFPPTLAARVSVLLENRTALTPNPTSSKNLHDGTFQLPFSP